MNEAAIESWTEEVLKRKLEKYPNSQERITVVICANMDGTEKRGLFAVGKFHNPRRFKCINKLPVTYEGKRKAWVTAELFERWLRSFDRGMHRQQHKVLLVIDKCTAHKTTEGLRATELFFLPPNATSKLQPGHLTECEGQLQVRINE